MLGTLSETVNIAALQQENAQLIATVASLTSELDSTKDKLGSIVASLTSELDSFKQQLDSQATTGLVPTSVIWPQVRKAAGI